jgi:hypothetical protein
MNKQISRVWSFASDSNPNIEYESLQYTDGTTSCNCRGWTRRVAADGSCSCKHYVFKHILLSGVSAVVRPEGVEKHSVVARTIADTLPLN